MKTILDKIVADKRIEIECLKKEKPFKALEDEIANLLPIMSRFADCVKKKDKILIRGSSLYNKPKY